ncbi:MAG TPA: DinB family protein [Terriglobales bacterium]|nr:DinB family protein [Terriglobales bacterium]
MRFAALLIAVCLALPAVAQDPEVPKDVAGSVGATLHFIENEFLSVAQAMPEEKYGFVPTAGNFQGVRSFAEQVKHVACANFAFFNQIEGKKPPEHCEKGGPNPAKTKAELIQYLKDSNEYANRVLKTVNAGNMMQRVNGPYAGPNTRLGMTVTAVWHITDHYGQIVEYLRMNGIVPPSTAQYGLQVR